MRITTTIFFCFLAIAFVSCSHQKDKSIPDTDVLGIIPAPSSINYADKSFIVNHATEISAQGDNKKVVELTEYLSDEIQKAHNLHLKTKANASADQKNTLFFEIDDTIKNKEGYSIFVDQNQVFLKGSSPQALFYGAQTILQLLYHGHDASEQIIIPGVEIKDEPLFPWRGMHMDVSRHFFPVEFVKKMIDLISMHKMNTFHWHLTDDQGWRIEIKKYPKLTAIGAWRKETVAGHMSEHPYRFDGTKHGGYYTQEEIRDVIAYAKTKYVTIVPEIEMPGHAVAALSAYPEYSCTNGPFEVFPLWGVSDDVYCAGKEKTFQFLEDVLSEVIGLFPGEYIHVGGDECPKIRWKKCADCQKRIKAEGLKNEDELQGYFTRRIEKFLTSKGKKLIGWDEILDGGGLPARSSVMSWRGTEGGITAAKSNHDVIMTPGAFCYFDHYQDRAEHEPLAIGGYKTLEKVYSYDPMPKELTKEEAKHILGAQANVWTEYITSEKHFEYMVFPRLCAMAEILWTPKEKQRYKQFLVRMDKHYPRLDTKGVSYRIAMPEGFDTDNKFLEDTTIITLNCEIPSAEIRYSTDGSEPGKNSKLYDAPFTLSLETPKTLKAKTFLANGRSGTTRTGIVQRTNLLNDTTIINPVRGILYKYYTGEYRSAKNTSGVPASSGVINNFLIPDSLLKKEWFGMVYSGYIQVREDDVYTFYLNSDDGAILYIDNTIVIDNDGYHYGNEKAGQVALKSGFHSIRVAYFQGKFGAELDVKIKSTNTEKKEIAEGMLWH